MRIQSLKIVELQILLHQIRSNTALSPGIFYSKEDHIIKLYENRLIYTQVQKIRTFLKLRKSVRLVKQIGDAVPTFVHVRRTSLLTTLWYKVKHRSNTTATHKGWEGGKAARG